ncbi:hypothetical protein QLX67_07570 [Balneolaceae bacterium ANBcel3]|nr:hypothetical protein [Balneolaceae bacterium ANBcel3]
MPRNNILFIAAFAIICGLAVAGCDEIFGSKSDPVTDEIFDQGRHDPSAIVEEVGYSALLPFWFFDKPTDVHVGFDELVYVTDASGLHILDRAGGLFRTIELQGATTVVQDRMLNVYVSARYDTVVQAVDPDLVWNLPAVFKFENPGGGSAAVLDTIIMPFHDASRSTASVQRRRLNPDRNDNADKIEITGLGILDDNTLYVARRGPRNITGQPEAPDNTVLIYQYQESEGRMRNTGQIRALDPNNPTLASAVQIGDLTTFVGAPQRENITSDRSFLITQQDTTRDISFRVLWINALDDVEGIDGLAYRSRPQLLTHDTERADRFLYEQGRFVNPTGLAFSADARGHIFVTDAGTDSLYLFQSNGHEGVIPPAGSQATKAISVSFGGTGNGPRQFNNPSGVAYFRQVVYVADRDNNRISRYKLNTDLE